MLVSKLDVQTASAVILDVGLKIAGLAQRHGQPVGESGFLPPSLEPPLELPTPTVTEMDGGL